VTTATAAIGGAPVSQRSRGVFVHALSPDGANQPRDYPPPSSSSLPYLIAEVTASRPSKTRSGTNQNQWFLFFPLPILFLHLHLLPADIRIFRVTAVPSQSCFPNILLLTIPYTSFPGGARALVGLQSSFAHSNRVRRIWHPVASRALIVMHPKRPVRTITTMTRVHGIGWAFRPARSLGSGSTKRPSKRARGALNLQTRESKPKTLSSRVRGLLRPSSSLVVVEHRSRARSSALEKAGEEKIAPPQKPAPIGQHVRRVFGHDDDDDSDVDAIRLPRFSALSRLYQFPCLVQ
jgi:hypothetical protein